MEGTVTISLTDYEELKELVKIADSYKKTACEHIDLLDRIAEAVTDGNWWTEHKNDELLKDDNEALDKWYG